MPISMAISRRSTRGMDCPFGRLHPPWVGEQSPAVANGVINTLGYTGVVAADASNGILLWQAPSLNTITGGITVADDQVMFGDASGAVSISGYRVRAKTTVFKRRRYPPDRRGGQSETEREKWHLTTTWSG
jgi:outer membrane protein assembly factor BamB